MVPESSSACSAWATEPPPAGRSLAPESPGRDATSIVPASSSPPPAASSARALRARGLGALARIISVALLAVLTGSSPPSPVLRESAADAEQRADRAEDGERRRPDDQPAQRAPP